MEKEQYLSIVKKNKAKENKIFNLIKAFLIGGLFGMLGNFLIDFYSKILSIPTSDASVYMIITLIFFACLFTALGFFDNFVKFGRMGVIIPITGFAHAMQSSALDCKSEGLIYGLGSNIFKVVGSVLLYGIASACIFGLIKYFIGG